VTVDDLLRLRGSTWENYENELSSRDMEADLEIGFAKYPERDALLGGALAGAAHP